MKTTFRICNTHFFSLKCVPVTGTNKSFVRRTLWYCRLYRHLISSHINILDTGQWSLRWTK